MPVKPFAVTLALLKFAAVCDHTCSCIDGEGHFEHML